MSFRALQHKLDEFFFAPGPVIQLSVFRILFALIVLESSFLMLPEISVWLQPDSAVTLQSARSVFGVPSFSIWNFFPDSQAIAYIVVGALGMSALCLALGFKSRLAAAIIYICLLSIYHRNPLILHGGDTYMRQQSLWLALSQCGAALSIDRRLQLKEVPAFDVLTPKWPLRVVQLQFCFVYVSAFFSKIQCNRWIDGTALFYTSHLQEFQRLPVPFLFDNLAVCKGLTWASLAIEFALFTLIWYKPLRYPVLIAAAIFHLFIEWSMNVPLFEWLMIGSLVLFIDPKDLMQAINLFDERFRKSSQSPNLT